MMAVMLSSLTFAQPKAMRHNTHQAFKKATVISQKAKSHRAGEVTNDYGVITTPGEGSRKVYTRTGGAFMYDSETESTVATQQDSETEIVECTDGTVYIQDIISQFNAGTWVKGTKEGNTITIPTGQVIYYSTQYSCAYTLWWGLTSGQGDNEFTKVADKANITFTIDGNSIKLNDSDVDHVIGAFYDYNGTTYFDGEGDYNTVFTYLEDYKPLPVSEITAPADLQTEDWYISGAAYTDAGTKAFAHSIKIGFKDNDVYVQGVMADYPEAWMKGTLDGTTVTFSGLQKMGVSEDYTGSYEVYAVGITGSRLKDFQMTYDADNKTLTAINELLLNADTEKPYYIEWFTSIVFSEAQPDVPMPVVAPTDLQTEAYSFTGIDNYDDAEANKEVYVGFYGENEVYIQGLCGPLPEAWVKGTLTNGVLTIGETPLGSYDSYLGASELTFSGATFNYDATKNLFTSAEGFKCVDEYGEEWDGFTNVSISKVVEREATPSTPSPSFEQMMSYNLLTPGVSLVDTEGNAMLTDKLSYSIWYEKNNEQKVYELTTDKYSSIEANMTEIPYNFYDDYYISSNYVTIQETEEELQTWTKIGVQSIYRGNGVEHKSEIGWFDLATYWEYAGIANIKMNNNGRNAIYNLNGQRVNNATKGLYIINGKKVVIK